MFSRKEFGVRGGQSSDNFLGKLENLVSGRADTNWDENMKPPTARCLRE